MSNRTNRDFKVVITTSGLGSRLATETQNKNKSLVEVNNIPIISYIINTYPPDVELVVTLGYFGYEVKNFLLHKFPKRHIIFVTIDKFMGDGSSLGYSMLQAKTHLQCPFIFHCNDTLIFEPIPSPVNYNWNGGAKGRESLLDNSDQYSSFKVYNSSISSIQRKGIRDYDYLHIGLVGIKDYKAFWKYLERAYRLSPDDQTLNDVVAINDMIDHGYSFRPIIFSKWFDTGNLGSLQFAREEIKKVLY